MAARPTTSSDDYIVGWICALPCELDAARRALDQEYDCQLKLSENDQNVYVYGEINGFNIVIACPPFAEYGTTPATITAQHMKASFKSLRYRFLVGVGGGAPSKSSDIRLGDVVVSTPVGNDSGVIPYDWGKRLPSGEFQQIGTLNKPPQPLRRAISCLQTDHNFNTHLAGSLAPILTYGKRIECPAHDKDRLFASSYAHPDPEAPCASCDQTQVIPRKKRLSDCPRVHYGLIASGNQVMKDAVTRDELANSRGILCFEMEAAGLMDEFECLVVRGICDYSDSHKNKDWQPYAAASAAAYVKTLLKYLPRPIRKIPEDEVGVSPALEEILRKLFVTDPNEDRRSLMARRGGPSKDTCQWIFQTDELKNWLDANTNTHNPQNSILWLNGLPGSGKSTMAMCLTEGLEQQFNTDRKDGSFAFFFCEANHDTQNTATAILRGILWQLIRQNPILQDWLVGRFRERNDTLLQSFEGLWTILTEIATDPRCKISYCIIDALDECDSGSQTRILEQLKLSFFDRPSERFTSRVRILITSRPYYEIASCLGFFPSRDIATFIEERKTDIQLFIQQKVGDLSTRKGYHDKMKEQIQEILEAKADGTFLWIGLTCDELKDVDLQDTLVFLNNLAPGLNAIYTKLMEKAIENEQKRERVYAILAVVAVARQALTLSQLCTACSLYIGEDREAQIAFIRADIKDCRLMVVEIEGFVNLLHKSVQDFLFGADMRYFPSKEQSHALLAYACINHTARHFRNRAGRFEKLLDEYLHELKKKNDEYDVMKREAAHMRLREEISTWGDFIPYCSQFWMEHAHLSGMVFDPAKVTETHFLTLDSPSRDLWLRYYGLDPCHAAYNMGILHIAAEWGIPSLVNFALGKNLATEGGFYIDTDSLTSRSCTPLLWAALYGNIAVFTELVSRTDPTRPLTSSVLTALVEHNSNCENFITSLLQQMGSQIVVTEELEIAAVKNTQEGSEILKALLFHRDQMSRKRPHISTNVLVQAARNESQGIQIMKLIFTYLQNNVSITAEVLGAAAGNAECASALLDMLLEHWTEETIPEWVVAAAAAHPTEGPHIIRILQAKSQNAIPVTDDILASAFGNIDSGVACLEQLWKEWPYLTIVGGSAISYNSGGAGHEGVLCWTLSQPHQRVVFFKDAFRSILARRSVTVLEQIMIEWPGLHLSHDLLQAAASNSKHGASIFTFLFMSCPEQIQVTEDLVTEAVGSDLKTLEIILSHRPADHDVVNREALRKAAEMYNALEILPTLLSAKTGPFSLVGTRDTPDVMKFCLDQPNVMVNVDEDMMYDLEYLDEKEDLLKRILSLPDDQVQVSGAAAETIIHEYGRFHTRLLLRHSNVQLTNEGVNSIVEHQDPDTVSLMLNYQAIEVDRHLQDASCRNVDAGQVLAIIIESTSGDISVNERVLEIVLRECKSHIIEKYIRRLPPHTWRRELIRLLVSHQSNSQYTQSLVQLLLQCHQQAVIDHSLIEAIAKYCDESVMMTAIQRSSMFTQETVAAAMKNIMHGRKILGLLIGDVLPNVPVDTEFIHNLARISDPETIHRVFQQASGAPHGLSRFLLCWAAAENRNFNCRAIESILNINNDDLLQDGRATQRSSLCSFNPHWRLIPLTGAIIDALGRDEQSGPSFVQTFLHTCATKVWITGTGLRTIIRSFDVRFIRELFSHKILPSEVDDCTIQAGAANRRDGPRVLDFLLSQGTRKLEITGHTVSAALANMEHRKAIMSRLIASERTIFGQSAVAEIMKTLDPTMMADVFLCTSKKIEIGEACILEAIRGMGGSIPRIFTLLQHLLSLNLPLIVTADMIQEIPDSAADQLWPHDIMEKIQEMFNDPKNKVHITEKAIVEFIRRCFIGLDEWKPRASERLSQRYAILAMYCKQLPGQGIVDEEVVVELLHAEIYDFNAPIVLPDPFQLAIPVTEDWLCPIMMSGWRLSARKAYRMLEFLERVRPPLAITTGGALSILKTGDQEEARSIAQLLGDRLRMSQEVFVALVSVADETTIAYLFNHWGKNFKVTEDMLLAVVRNPQSTLNALNYVASFSPHIITAEIVMVLTETQHCDAETLNSLLQRLPAMVLLSEDFLITISESKYHGEEVMECLKDCVDTSIFRTYLSEEVFIETAKNEDCGGPLMDTLLKVPDSLPITEEVIVLAALSIPTEPPLFGHPVTEAHVKDLLCRVPNPRFPSLDFLETAFSLFGSSLLAFMTDIYKQVGELNPGLIQQCPVRREFSEFQESLTKRGLLQVIDGRWLFGPVAHEAIHRGDESNIRKLTLETADPVLTDIFITAEMVEDELESHDGPKDIIKSLLEQKAGRVIVTAEGFLAIIKSYSLSTIELMATKSEAIVIPSILFVSSPSPGVEDIKHPFMGFKSRSDLMETLIMTVVTNNSGQNVAILRYMFVRFGCPAVISSNALRAAASSPYNPTGILELLLCCNRGMITETESIVLAAAANPIEGDRLIALVFDHLGDQILVSEPMLVAAARNKGSKYAFSKFLSLWKGQVSVRVFVAASANPVFAVEIMELLLKKYETPITEDVLIEAARNQTQGDKLLDLICRERHSQFSLTVNIVQAALGRVSHKYRATGHCRVPELFLDPTLYVDPHSVQVTAILSRSLSYTQFKIYLSKVNLLNPQDLALELAQECNDVTLRMVLERYGSEIALSEELLTKAARNTHWRTNILKVFIYTGDDNGQAITVTRDMVVSAAANPRYGYESVQMLRTRHTGGPFVNFESLLATASNEGDFSLRLLRLLYRCSQGPLPITTKLLSAAAKNPAHGMEMLRLLLNRLEKQDDNDIAYEEVAEAAASNTATIAGKWGEASNKWADTDYIWCSPLGLLIRRRRHRIKFTESLLAAAASNPKMGRRFVLLLIKCAGSELTITGNVLCKAAKNPQQGYDVLMLLLHHPRLKHGISENVIAAVAANDHHKNWERVLGLLLAHHGAPFQVSEGLVLAIVQSEEYRDEKLKVLLEQHQGPICISDEVMQNVSARGKGRMEYFLEAL
ncbi:hypothetical protein AtubIFM57258_010426 [Aspergillus tubingensis]|nr:hypothetical protein AtubIFM57258_010426 [Aspergillus tubingensis]